MAYSSTQLELLAAVFECDNATDMEQATRHFLATQSIQIPDGQGPQDTLQEHFPDAFEAYLQFDHDRSVPTTPEEVAERMEIAQTNLEIARDQIALCQEADPDNPQLRKLSSLVNQAIVETQDANPAWQEHAEKEQDGRSWIDDAVDGGSSQPLDDSRDEPYEP